MGSLILDSEKRSAQVGGRTVNLLRREYDLLSYLLENQGLVRTRDQILDAVWPGEFPTDRTVDDHVYRIRKKVEPLLGTPFLFTVRGVGYMARMPGSAEGEVWGGLTGQAALEAYLNMLRGSVVRGLGCQARALLENPPPGHEPGAGERGLLAWLTGDLEELFTLALEEESEKATILASLVAEDLFGMPVALGVLDSVLARAQGFQADGRVLRSIYLVERNRLDEARREIYLAEREVEAQGARILRPTIARARALILLRGGYRRNALAEIDAGLDLARRLGVVREEALLQHLSTGARGEPGYREVLSLLEDNCLETDRLIVLRQLAARDPAWRPEFSRLARQRDLPPIARMARRLFGPRRR